MLSLFLFYLLFFFSVQSTCLTICTESSRERLTMFVERQEQKHGLWRITSDFKFTPIRRGGETFTLFEPLWHIKAQPTRQCRNEINARRNRTNIDSPACDCASN